MGKPLMQGGLGIRSLQIINRTLLNKWLRRFGVERNSLWWWLVAAKEIILERHNPWTMNKKMTG